MLVGVILREELAAQAIEIGVLVAAKVPEWRFVRLELQQLLLRALLLGAEILQAGDPTELQRILRRRREAGPGYGVLLLGLLFELFLFLGALLFLLRALDLRVECRKMNDFENRKN